MTDTPDPAALDIQPGKPGLLKRLSFVWLVPVLALAVTLGVAYRSYADQGVLITIIFEQADGIKADETVIKFRDVDVGLVETVAFDDNLRDVIVSARVDQKVAPFLDQSAFFWVVSPDVSLRGVTGLETVLSGVYIEGTWDDEPDNAQTEFRGLEDPPLGGANARGTSITLRARDASALAEGAPVLHKGLEVGHLSAPQLSFNGDSVTVDAFINFPYDQRITTSTRFWDTSGFSVNVGAAGLSLDVNSLSSLIKGGIAFDTVVSGGAPVRDGQLFDIFADELTASESIFNDPDQPTADIAVRFDDNVSGLRRGSDVRFQGIRVGQVRDISAIVVEDTESMQVELQAVLAIEPGRLGLGEGATPEDAIIFLTDFVASGLRARLVTGNILSGTLTVELLRVETALPAAMDPRQEPYPVMPTTTNVITDVADTAEGVLTRINDLPIEQLLESAINLMDSLESLASDPTTQQVPGSAVALLDGALALVASDDVQAIPTDTRGVIQGVQSMVDDLAAAQLATRLGTTLDAADAVAGNLVDGTENLPAISAEIEALVARANALELEALIAQADATLAAATAYIEAEDAAALPASLRATLDETRGLVADARGLVASDEVQAIPGDVQSAIAGAQSVINDVVAAGLAARIVETLDNANAVAANVVAGTDNLPAVSAELEALIAKANALELEALVDETTATLGVVSGYIADEDTAALPGALVASLDEVTSLVADARALVAAEDVQAIPGDLRESIAGLNAIITEANDSNIVAGLAATIESARASAASVEDAIDGLPAIVDELEKLAAQANSLELDRLVSEATNTLASIDTLIGSDATQDLPASLSGALDEMRLVLSQVREGGAITNVNAALASASDAARAIEQAAAALPALTAQARALVAQTDNVLSAYGDRSRFNSETLAALRDIQEAADAVSALARAIQRNPNSLLTGR